MSRPRLEKALLSLAMRLLTRHLDLFKAIADPLGEPVEVPAADVPQIVDLAIRHRLSALVARRLAHSRVVPGCERLRDDALTLTALTLRLDRCWSEIGDDFAHKGVRARLVKGPDFAAALYPVAADRPFTDLDLLVHEDELDDVAEILQARGLVQSGRRGRRSETPMAEQKWRHQEDPGLLVEVHTDLVHYPHLRSRVRFNLAILNGPDLSDALARFLIATVHGLLGHKLHEYRMVVDLLQSYRALSALERLALPQVSRSLGLAFEVGIAVGLLDRLYGVPDGSRVVTQTGRSASRLAGCLLGPREVLDPSRQPGPRLRRHAVRALQVGIRR